MDTIDLIYHGCLYQKAQLQICPNVRLKGIIRVFFQNVGVIQWNV